MAKSSTKAHEMAENQRQIAISEFFEKNRHLLGFDNKKKALMTTIKEAVDNSLDACEEADILPEVMVEIIDLGNDKYRIIVEDNGPGVVKKQIPNVFGKLLYGSKFHRLKQGRGQQGIGISAAALYSQLTTHKPVKIISRVGKKYEAHAFQLRINTAKNEPEIISDEVIPWTKEHGVRVEMDMEASYQGGAQSVDEYIKETAIVNPHATLIYTNPKSEQLIFARATDQLPSKAKEIQPHLEGVELGILLRMARRSKAKTMAGFLSSEFSRIGATTAKQLCAEARILETQKPSEFNREEAERLINATKKVKLMAPPTDCLSPIGGELLEKGLRKEIQAEFYTTVSRSPAVYRGNPFIIEVGVAYGGNQPGDQSARMLRFANRVPLLYQQSACALTKAVMGTGWKSYGIDQSKGALPSGPLTIVMHIASVWVPFTSESKEATASYPELLKEMKLALQEAGRQLGKYVKKKKRIRDEEKKRGYIEKYIPHVAAALKDLEELKEGSEKKIEENLAKILEHTRGELEEIKVQTEGYDEELAKIGRGDKSASQDDEQ